MHVELCDKITQCCECHGGKRLTGLLLDSMDRRSIYQRDEIFHRLTSPTLHVCGKSLFPLRSGQVQTMDGISSCLENNSGEGDVKVLAAQTSQPRKSTCRPRSATVFRDPVGADRTSPQLELHKIPASSCTSDILLQAQAKARTRLRRFFSIFRS